MRARLETRLAVALAGAAALAGACSGAPLGGGTGGSPGFGGAPCTIANGCLRGSGGVPGTGGGSGGSNALCDDLTTTYNQTVMAAFACTPGAAGQCQAVIDVEPSVCPGSDCPNLMYANDATSVEAVRGKWVATCASGATGCPAIACSAPPAPATCLPNGAGATTGACVPYGSASAVDIAPPGGESCNQLVADYQAAVAAAQVCTPGAPSQCQSYVNIVPAAGPDPAECQPLTLVNDASGVNAALAKWSAQCQLSSLILLIKCDPPTFTATCVPNADAGTGANSGTCVVAGGGLPIDTR